MVTAVLITERESEDIRCRSAIVRLEREVHDGLASIRGRLVGSH